MAGRESERRKLLREGFMTMKNEGKTIAEIAEFYQVSLWTAYHALDEIAKEHGLKREDLLDVVHSPHNYVKRGGEIKKSEYILEPEEVVEGFIELDQIITEIRTKISEIVQEEE